VIDLDTFWRDRPTLVTGATGLVGSWLVRRLLELQASVVCLVRDWVPGSELVRSRELSRTTVVRGDIQDAALLERVLGEYEVDTVFHLAAQTIVGIANRNPLSTFETNIRGTWLLLEACRRSPTTRQIVVASSDKAYGVQEELPYTEEAPLAGCHPYDVSKSCADLLSTSYARTYGLPVVTTRCGNFFGGGDLNFNRLIPGTIRAALRGDRPVVRSDGSPLRDYFYVENGVDAYLTSARCLAEDATLAGEAFNFSDEAPISVLDMVRRVLVATGSDLEPEVRAEATNEIPHQYLSSDKAHRVLGWRSVVPLDEGLSRTVTWYREHFRTGTV
jgi:CDP-glucose 4,6-dehydratase